MEDSDQELLHRFASGRDELSFQMLVQRHLGLVHAVARRVTASEDLARDVAQATFIRLAERAPALSREMALTAWLHRTCRSLAIDLVRAETRRRRLEEKSSPSAMDPHSTPEPAWEQMAPVIDELVNQLSTRDRELLLLRYYENRPHGVIGQMLGLSEQAARMRSVRALEKLRTLLARRGIATSSAALTSLLPAYGSAPASTALTLSVLQATQGVAPLAATGAAAAISAHKGTLATIGVIMATAALVVSFAPPAASPALSSSGTKKASPAPRTPAAKPWDAAAAIEHLRTVDAQAVGKPAGLPPFVAALQDWTIDELRTAVEQALRSPDMALPHRGDDQSLMLLTQVWMQKDLAGFLAWRETLPNPNDRDIISGIATREWPPEKGAEALSYTLNHPDSFAQQGNVWTSQAVALALQTAAYQSPAAVAECLTTAQEHHLPIPVSDLHFPAGFDFKSLLANPGIASLCDIEKPIPAGEGSSFTKERVSLHFLLHSWYQRNPDEAFDTLLARGRELHSLPADYLYPFTDGPITSDQAAWLTNKMKALEPDERRSVWAGNAVILTSGPDNLQELIAASSDPGDIRQFHEIGAGEIALRGFEAALPHLEALGDPATRLAFLENLPEEHAIGFPWIDQELEQKNETALRAKLFEWGATPEQVEKILSLISF